MSIYKVFFKNSDECYIGSTRGDLQMRLEQHIIHVKSPSRKTQCSVRESILKHGILNVDIQLIEKGEWTDQEMYDRERYWILNTPGAVNKNIPQAEETSARTNEGKLNYLKKWRTENKEHIKEQVKIYTSKPEVKERMKEVQQVYKQEHADEIKARKQELIICPKCGLKTSRGNKWRHDATCEEKMKEKEERKKDYDMLVELRKTMTFRAIVLHEYFQGRPGYKNHQSLQKLEKDFLT